MLVPAFHIQTHTFAYHMHRSPAQINAPLATY